MTVKEFINKWSPAYHLEDEMREDLISTTQEHQYQNIAVDILTNINGSELKLYTKTYKDHKDKDYVDGRLSYGKIGKSEDEGVVISYSLAIGLHEADWRELLKYLINLGFKQL